jgi:hypothetical protein
LLMDKLNKSRRYMRRNLDIYIDKVSKKAE